MTFVPWHEYNICKKHALPHGECNDRLCPWNHPPAEELRRLWDAHDETKMPPQRSSVGHFEQPLPHPLREGLISLDRDREQFRRTPRSATGSLPPAWTQQQSRVESGMDPYYWRLSSSPNLDMLPRRLEVAYSQAHVSSSPRSIHTPPRDIDKYRPQQQARSRETVELSDPLEPAPSANDFINGAVVYRFVWGNPLCVRCGLLGHLPAQCDGMPLSLPEQDYLFKLVKREQCRSKREDPKPSAAKRRSDSSSREVSSEPQMFWQRPASLPSNRRPAIEADNDIPHKRNFNDFSDFMDGSRDRMPFLAHTKPLSTSGKWMSHHGEEGSVKLGELGKRTAPAPSDFIHPSRVALVADHTDISPHTTAAPSSEASVPPGTQHYTTMGATKRMSNGEAKIIGPHPSTLRVSASYITQAAIDKRLASEGLDAQERSLAEAREDTVRLQGVAWLDNVRRALQLPVKTFTTAVVYYHKFRLAHPKEDYQWIDAAAASLLTSCKNEDTLKKSRDILAAAYNMKQSNTHEQVASDDPMFEAQSRMVIGMERLILESGGFDFRSRAPHHTLVKIAKSLPPSSDLKDVSQLAWTVLTDLHRTFAPLKQTSSTLALASLELAAHFTAAKAMDHNCTVRENLQRLDLRKWYTTREEVMETLLDALDLYTHNTASSILGTKYSLDDLLRIRLALNKECSDSSLPRYTMIQPPPSPDNANGTSSTLRVANGHPTPVSPPQPGAAPPAPVNAYTATNQHTPQTEGTLRFMLNPQRATEERAQVNSYYTEEWEEVEEEIEVPLPRSRPYEGDNHRDREGFSRHDRDRDRDHDRDSHRARDFEARRGLDDRSAFDRRGQRDGPRAAPAPLPEKPRVARQPQSNMLQSVVRAPSPAPEILVDKEEDKESQQERGTDSARERARSRDRERRYDDRRGDGRDRYDSRRDRDSREDRRSGGSGRYYDDDRRRERR